MKTGTLIVWLLVPTLLLGQGKNSNNDWPQWRGPDRQGVWYNGPEVDALSPHMIQELWSVEVGPGYNGPTVSHGRVYVMDFVEGRERIIWGFNELGELLLGQLRPEGYKDLGRVKVIDPVRISPNPRNGVCWAHPAFSGHRIFIRSDEQLVCVQIKNP